MTPDETSNPFSTRFTRPGAFPYQFCAGDDAARCVSRLAELHWWAQIVGPHGSGKSSLVRALLPAIATAGKTTELVVLTQGQRWWHATRPQRAAWNSATLLIVDGYEQLSAWSRWRLRRALAQARAGLLVTTHSDMGLPTLAATTVTLEFAQAMAVQLQATGPVLVTAEDVAQRFDLYRDNLRELLFDLYDLYEMRRPRSLP